MKRFKVENLCTFTVTWRHSYTSRDNHETVISMHLKKIKDNQDLFDRARKIFKNKVVVAVKPKNKRAYRLVENVKKRERPNVRVYNTTTYVTINSGTWSTTGSTTGNYWIRY